MGFLRRACLGGKWCRRNECKDRCDSWFGTMPDVRDACRAACAGNISFSKEEFLCSGNYVDQEYVIGRYKYDPCLDDDTTLEGFLDPLSDREREEEKRNDLMPLIAGLAMIFLAGLIIISTAR
ncbi:hypothetical protein [Phaeodactylibacter xiamenensis]|uniref:hypothetical protein n=1 Tax=Phaeodactylibacter xiamenensis TaxID=1524460 RepID=UPI003CCB7FDB